MTFLRSPFCHDLNLTDEERSSVRRELDVLVETRAGDRGSALLTNPINIGVATK